MKKSRDNTEAMLCGPYVANSRNYLNGLTRRPVATALASAFVIVAFTLFARGVLARPISFDGGLNLLAASGLTFDGYYGYDYGGETVFPAAVRTNGVFALLASAVLAMFGIGIWQAQLTNLIFVALLIAAIYRIFSTAVTRPVALIAATAPLFFHSVGTYGMNGYGEIPMLSVMLWAVIFLFIKPHRSSNWRIFTGFLLAGMAVGIKDMAALGAVVVLLTWMTIEFRGRKDICSSRLRPIGFVVAFAAPLAMWEAWRLASLGIADWISHQAHNVNAISRQAGIASGFADTSNVAEKIVLHSKIIAFEVFGFNTIAVPAVAIVIVISWIVASSKLSVGLNRGVVFALSNYSFAYALWFIALTPSSKAWERRIFFIHITLYIVAIVSAADIWKFLRQRRLNTTFFAACVGCTVFVLLTFVHAMSSFDPVDKRETTLVSAIASTISDAPEPLVGIDWYFAPHYAFYAQRRQIYNINELLPAELRDLKRGHFVIDAGALASGRVRLLERFYSSRRFGLSDTAPDVLEISFRDGLRAPRPSDAELRVTYLDEQSWKYPAVNGVVGNWARTEIVTMLYSPSNNSVLTGSVFLPNLELARASGMEMLLFVNSCQYGPFDLKTGMNHFTYDIEQSCLLSGEYQEIRIMTNNYFKSLDDWRQLSYVPVSLGFFSQEALDRDSKQLLGITK